MNHLPTILLLSLSYIAASLGSFNANAHSPAWNISPKGQMPRPGDRMSVAMLDMPLSCVHLPSYSERNSLTDTVWDFSTLGIRDNGLTRSFSYWKEPGSIACTFAGQRSYYRICGDSIYLTGYETRNVMMTDSVGILSWVFPDGTDRLHSSPFKLKGTYSVEQSAVRYGICSSFSGRLGKLILPEGDTINDIIYVISEEKYNSDISLDPARLAGCFSDTVPMSIRKTMYCYARGYRYPVLEICRTERIYGKERKSDLPTALLCSTSEQEFSIKSDDYNMELRKETDSDPSPDNESPSPEGMPVKNASLNLQGDMLELNFDSESDAGFIELIISDSGGIRYQYLPRTPIHEGRNTVSINCSGMPAKEYGLLLIYGEHVISLKFTLR